MNFSGYIQLVNEEIKDRFVKLLEKFENKELLEINMTLKKLSKIEPNKLYEKKLYNLLNKPKYYTDFIKFALQHNNFTLIDLNKGNMHKFKKESKKQLNFEQRDDFNFFGAMGNNINSNNTSNSVVDNALKNNTMNHYFYINKLI
jgi:hypothetical protein